CITTTPLVPYTTLFRSEEDDAPLHVGRDDRVGRAVDEALEEVLGLAQLVGQRALRGDVAEGEDGHLPLLVQLPRGQGQDQPPPRSEEHTSELQSRENHV